MGNSLWIATFFRVRLEYELAPGQHLLGGVWSLSRIWSSTRRVSGRGASKSGRRGGLIAEAPRIFLLQGTVLCGKPSPKVRRALAQVTDLDVLESLLLRVVQVGSRTELLEVLRKGIPSISSPCLDGGTTG